MRNAEAWVNKIKEPLEKGLLLTMMAIYRDTATPVAALPEAFTAVVPVVVPVAADAEVEVCTLVFTLVSRDG